MRHTAKELRYKNHAWRVNGTQAGEGLRLEHPFDTPGKYQATSRASEPTAPAKPAFYRVNWEVIVRN
ncbi:MAG: hypothetical protein ACLFTT_05030 [Candidatus Hydrogenedentota bacterium]